MRFIINILISLISTTLGAQNLIIPSEVLIKDSDVLFLGRKIPSCEDGYIEALNNIEKGRLTLYDVDTPHIEATKTFVRLLRDEYNLGFRTPQCMFGNDVICYGRTMNQEIKKRFGVRFVDSLLKEANILDSSGLGDINSFYKENTQEGFCRLFQFLQSNLNYNELPYDSIKGTIVIVSAIVKESGRLRKFRIDSTNDDRCNEEAIRVAKKLDFWIPATIKGIPIDSKIYLRFVFDKDYKVKSCP